MRYFGLLFFCGFLLAAVPASAQLKLPLGLRKMRIPSDNPITPDKVELGKLLYFDKRLSSDNTVSCASCHDPAKGWSNGERFATGVGGQKGGRSAPTIINAGYQYFQFWDGRAKQLEGQALGPIANPIEMNLPLDKMVAKLKGIKGYRDWFQKVFEGEITEDRVAKAIATFERTIVSGNSPYDQFKAGKKDALSESAQRGMKLFFNKGHCSACHVGPNFSDGAFHNVGIGADDPKKPKDDGRFAVTKLGGDRASFRTPTLREIARTAPYMHDGSLATLKDVVKYYNRGGNANEWLDEEIFPLKLTDMEVDDLVEFLKALSSPDYPDVKPPKKFPE